MRWNINYYYFTRTNEWIGACRFVDTGTGTGIGTYTYIYVLKTEHDEKCQLVRGTFARLKRSCEGITYELLRFIQTRIPHHHWETTFSDCKNYELKIEMSLQVPFALFGSIQLCMIDMSRVKGVRGRLSDRSKNRF